MAALSGRGFRQCLPVRGRPEEWVHSQRNGSSTSYDRLRCNFAEVLGQLVFLQMPVYTILGLVAMFIRQAWRMKSRRVVEV